MYAVIASLLPALWATPADAYVRKRTEDVRAIPLSWSDPRLNLDVALPLDGLGVSADQLRAAAEEALEAWSYPAISCTGLALRLAPEMSDSQVAGRDYRNRIVMRTGQWCLDPTASPPRSCHDASIVALTTAFTRGGHIVEADIEINAVGDYQWAVIPDPPFSGRDYANYFDLATVLTHEMGHFVGLEHNCVVPGGDPLVDDRGAAAPDCYAPSSEQQTVIGDATMYPFMGRADVRFRTLTEDDARFACDVYPAWDEWSGGSGCTLGAAAPAHAHRPVVEALAFLAAASLSFWATRRRRRSCRERAQPRLRSGSDALFPLLLRARQHRETTDEPQGVPPGHR